MYEAEASQRIGVRTMAKVRTVSKRHERKSFSYWWDVWDDRKRKIAQAGELTLQQRDTGYEAVIRAQDLLPLLTEERRTTRGLHQGRKGHWGLYVLPERPDHIYIEPGIDGTPAHIKVMWVSPS